MNMLPLSQIGDVSQSYPPVSFVGGGFSPLPFGAIFFETISLLRNGGVDPSKTTAAADTFPEEKIVIPPNVTLKNLSTFSFYDLLGLGDWGCTADNETMKKCYHKAVLLYHPDKKQLKSHDPEEDRQVFLKIQEAYNTLTNEAKRRAYDSQLDFDETVPTEKEEKKALKKGAAGFCQLYDPVFKRNSRFALRKPVPHIGDENTPINKVYDFYDYWIKFDSWRDFSKVGVEHNPDNAGSREERRWMIQENEKVAKKNKKKELTRITDLVMHAMEIDPRIVADKEAKKQAKESVKLAKEAESRRKQEELEAARKFFEEEERKAVEEAKNSKAEKEKLKKLQSKGRNTLRKLVRACSESTGREILEDDLEQLCSALDLVDLNTVNEAMGGEAATKNNELLITAGLDVAFEYLNESKKSKEEKEEEDRRARDERRQAEETRKKALGSDRNENTKEHFTTTEEMSMLSKAASKFPAGSRNRWMSICNYLNDLLKPPVLYTEDECIRAAHNAMQAHIRKVTPSTATSAK